MWEKNNISIQRCKKAGLFISFVLIPFHCFCWGFFGHQKINLHAVFLLPPEMIGFYKANIRFLSEHAVDPDMRRYAVKEEAPRHYIDLDLYKAVTWDSLPKKWKQAVEKFGEDSLQEKGIVPWWVETMYYRLVSAFKEKNFPKILKLSAEIGHYIGDAHVPLHATSNHNGQYTGQKGIHGFWESRVPELLAEKEWSFFIGRAVYISDVNDFIWKRVRESAAATDSVLVAEKILTNSFPSDKKFSFEERNGKLVRQYSSDFTKNYDALLNGMVERRMRQAIFAVASFWYSAWVDAGQPDLPVNGKIEFTDEEKKEFDWLSAAWRNGEIKGRNEEDQ
jgi:hypothetical protein